jgi:hypothetical protein
VAKGKRVGVWRGEYQRPWDYRKVQRWGGKGIAIAAINGS